MSSAAKEAELPQSRAAVNINVHLDFMISQTRKYQ
jgi:hypothetical protein